MAAELPKKLYCCKSVPESSASCAQERPRINGTSEAAADRHMVKAETRISSAEVRGFLMETSDGFTIGEQLRVDRESTGLTVKNGAGAAHPFRLTKSDAVPMACQEQFGGNNVP